MENRSSAIKNAILILMIIALTATATACRTKTDKTADKKRLAPPDKAHFVSNKDYKDILRDAAEDIKLLNQVREDTRALEHFMANPVLGVMAKQVQDDAASGKIKVRKLNKVRFKFANYTKGVAGLGMEYKDGSYYIDKKTGEQITKPTNKKEKRAIALQKIKGRWKIFGIYGGLKPNVPRK